MAAARARYIPDLVQVHIDDLAFVWGQRREALGSRRHSLREYAELNERLEAHLQGVLVAPPAALGAQLQMQLAGPDRDETFAAAFALLRLSDTASTHAVVVEFSHAQGAALAGLRDAFSLAPHALFAAEMRSALDQAKPPTAVAAAAVLANHHLLDAASPRLARLIDDEDAAVAQLAWRVAAVVDANPKATPPPRPYKAALSHASVALHQAAWSAAAWSGRASAMPLLRQMAAAGDTAALHWLAVLGTEADAPVIQNAALAMEDATQRCELLARFGHPSALNALLRWMSTEDVLLAVAAREAFTRLTGQDIRGERRQLPVPDDADDFTREMAPDVWLPDVDKARALFERHGATWAAGARWCNGLRLDGVLPRGLLVQLDLEARWDAAARACMAGQPISIPPPIH
jgi:uncharacterized protein (TIGR02270 family)